MTSELQRAYDVCQGITKTRAKNFYYAFRTLPAHQRRAIYVAYAFCRLCDDIADGETNVEYKRTRLAETKDLLKERLSSESTDPVFHAVHDIITTFSIPIDLFKDVVDGVEMDLTLSQFTTFDQLRDYCYGVASAVGLISIEVFGYDDDAAKEYAVDLGIAMQLTNILRDIKEDLQRGRIYIPLDEVAKFGYSPEQLMNGVVNEQFVDLMRFQVARARRYFISGQRLIPLLTPAAQSCPAILVGVYSAILDRIELSGFDIFQRRIALNTRQKLFIMAKIWATNTIQSHLQRKS